MSAFRDQLAEAASAVAILSTTRHAWLGRPSEALPDHVGRGLSDDDARGFLLFGLERRLYADFYCHGRAVVSGMRAQPDDPRGDPVLVAALTRANAGAGCWEPGWTFRGRENGAVIVERGGLTLWAPDDACRGLPDGEAGAGVAVEVRFPNELRRVSPGFYMSLAERALDQDSGVVRLYWNLRAEGAAAFVGEATRVMRDARLAARMKVANHPLLYDRCDAGVVYLQRDEAGGAAEAMGALRSAIAGHLKPGVPAFTRRLAAGVGLAVDPGGGESFGLHRCRLVAEGLVRAHEHGARSLHDRVDTVAARFVEAGMNPDAPYLGDVAAGDCSAAIAELAAAIGG